MRFPISTWTVTEAKKWLKDNNITFISFEKATKTKAEMEKEMDEEIREEIKKQIEEEINKEFENKEEDEDDDEEMITRDDIIDVEIIEKSFFIPIKKLNDEKQLVYGVVLEPEKVDAQNEIISEEEIEKCAHDFLRNYNLQGRMGIMHKFFDRKLNLVESYIAPANFELNGDKVRKGSWIAVTHILDSNVWKLVQEGKIGGYSIGGKAHLIPTK